MKFFRISAFLILSLLLAEASFAAPKKVYLVNGLLSKALGYGLTNLSKKMPYAKHFKFAGGVTDAAINAIVSDATAAYNADPTTQISLVGISQGANAVSSIAAALNRNGVKVHYLATIEGVKLSPVYANVEKADNFVCTGGSCGGKPLRRAGGNSSTLIQTISLDTGHIDSGNHPSMHSRVINQVQ